MVLLYWRIFHTIRQRTRKSIAAAAATSTSSAQVQQHRKSTPTPTTGASKAETTMDGRKSMPTLTSPAPIQKTIAVTELIIAAGSDEAEAEMEQKPETGRLVVRDTVSMATTDKTAAVTVAPMARPHEAEPKPETGQLLLDMTSSTIESRRRQRRRLCDDTSSDGDRETALIAHVNSDEIAQLSSDSQNSK